jgi:ABC-type lipoprotein export system ATPase subunit
LDLAILFAFRDILGCSSLKTNICIIDEILDSAIDTVTLNSVMSILKNKSKIDNQSIYVISHREGLAESDIFDHKIRIEKENGNSKVYQEF